jgi:hypothetical protein
VIPGAEEAWIRHPGTDPGPALNILRAHGVANVSEAIYTNALSFDCLLACGLPKAQN